MHFHSDDGLWVIGNTFKEFTALNLFSKTPSLTGRAVDFCTYEKYLNSAHLDSVLRCQRLTPSRSVRQKMGRLPKLA